MWTTSRDNQNAQMSSDFPCNTPSIARQHRAARGKIPRSSVPPIRILSFEPSGRGRQYDKMSGGATWRRCSPIAALFPRPPCRLCCAANAKRRAPGLARKAYRHAQVGCKFQTYARSFFLLGRSGRGDVRLQSKRLRAWRSGRRLESRASEKGGRNPSRVLAAKALVRERASTIENVSLPPAFGLAKERLLERLGCLLSYK